MLKAKFKNIFDRCLDQLLVIETLLGISFLYLPLKQKGANREVSALCIRHRSAPKHGQDRAVTERTSSAAEFLLKEVNPGDV